MVATAKTKMIVMPASRMLSAISFGVFCRCAPSTRAIIRSRNVEPGAAVMRTLIQSEITCVPPVTAERSPPLSRITGADSPVIAASLTEATPSITSPSLGMRSPASTSTTSPGSSSVADTCRHVPRMRSKELRRRFRLRLSQRRRLRLAAALGDRLRKVGEQHGEPQPEIDLEGEAGVAGAGDEVADEQERRQRGDHLDREHHGVAHHDARVELLERLDGRRPEDFRIGQRGDRPLAGVGEFHGHASQDQ